MVAALAFLVDELKDWFRRPGVISAPSTLKGGHQLQAQQQRFSIRLDWLSFNLPLAAIDRVKTLLGGASPWRREYRPKNGYRKCENLGEIRLFYDSRFGGDHAQLLMSGRALANLPLLAQLRLVCALERAGCRVNRLHLAFDDLEGRLSIDRVESEWDAGNVVAHWKSMSARTDTARGGACLGRSLTFGSRESDTSACIYQKALESGSNDYPDWVRVELRLSGKPAEEAMRELLQVCGCDDPSELPDVRPMAWLEHEDPTLFEDERGNFVTRRDFAHDPEALRRVTRRALEILRRRVDFRDRTTGGGNVTRAKPLRWWEEWLERFDAEPSEAARLQKELKRAQAELEQAGDEHWPEAYERREEAAREVGRRAVKVRRTGEQAGNDAFGQALAEYRAANPDFTFAPLLLSAGVDEELDESDSPSPGANSRPALRVIQGGKTRSPPSPASQGPAHHLSVVASKIAETHRRRSGCSARKRASRRTVAHSSSPRSAKIVRVMHDVINTVKEVGRWVFSG